MQEQMEQQVEQLQQGLATALDSGTKLAGPAVRTNRILMGSFTRLLKDQFEFGQACVEIGRRQMTAVAGNGDVTALAGARDALSAYYAAMSRYGEAVCGNARDTREQMTTVGREVAQTVAELGTAAAPQAAPAVADKPAVDATRKPARKAPGQATGQAARKTSGKATGKASKKTPARAATEKAVKAPGKTTSSKTTADARPVVDTATEPASKVATSATPAKTTTGAADKTPSKTSGKTADKVNGGNRKNA